jgi:hypothetical protein
MAMSLFPSRMEAPTFIIKKTIMHGLKLHLYLTEKDEIEKKDPEVKARKNLKHRLIKVCHH